jgi:hypothetical protein
MYEFALVPLQNFILSSHYFPSRLESNAKLKLASSINLSVPKLHFRTEAVLPSPCGVEYQRMDFAVGSKRSAFLKSLTTLNDSQRNRNERHFIEISMKNYF